MTPKRSLMFVGLCLAAALAIFFTSARGSSIVQSAYSLIENSGSPLTRRQILNFTTNMTCVDDPGNQSTDCSSSGGSGGGSGSGGALTSESFYNSASATQYMPVSGASQPFATTNPTTTLGTTESQVQMVSPATATVSGLYVQLNAAPGMGNSLVFTFRDNASNTSLTCTVSGASATICSDTTDTASVTAADLVSYSVVQSGGTPVAVLYIAASIQFGIVGATANPQFTISNAASTGTTLNTLTTLTGAPSTAVIATAGATGGIVGITTAGAGTSGTATITTAGKVPCLFDGGTTSLHYVQQSSGTNGACTDAGAAYPTSGQVVGRVLSTNGSGGTYTIDLFPSEIRAGGGGGITFAPPYLFNGTNYYVAGTGYQATLPPASPSWINGVAPNITATAGPNGDYVAVTTGANWQTQSCSTSVEAEFAPVSGSFSNAQDWGIWMYDSTNSIIWEFMASNHSGVPEIQVNEWSYSGSGNPSYVSTVSPSPFSQPPFQALPHFKISVAAGTATFAASANGGGTFATLQTESVGTISQCGFDIVGASSNPTMIDVYSLKTN